MSRLAPALEVFPTLQRFSAMRPRHLAQVPIGCRSLIVDPPTLQHSALHLYHDLGVLVYAGCSPSQVSRIGDVLRQIVSWGGIGGVVSMLDGREKKRSQEPIQEEGIFDKLKVDRTGHIKKDDLFLRATQRCEITLLGMKTELPPEFRDMVIGCDATDSKDPLPRGKVIHETVKGRRQLPIESFSSIYAEALPPHYFDNNFKRTIGEARFFTVGTGTYVGSGTVEFTMRKSWDEDEDFINPFWNLGKLKERSDPSEDVFEGIMVKVMEPLWEIERQVWADRAEAVERGEEGAVE